MSRRGGPLAAALVWAASALALPAAASAAPASEGVRVLTSGNRSERVEKLPITPKAWAKPRAAIRIGRGRMPALGAGDVLRAGAELQLTNDCVRPDPRCAGPTYRFSPAIEGRLMLTAPGGVRRRLGRGHEVCGQDEPHREHHCVLVIAPRARTLRGGDACERCTLSLVVSAHDPKAHGSERILLGGQRPDGSIPQDRGRVNLIAIRPGSGPARVGTTTELRRSSSPMDKRRRVVASKKLRRLRGGEGIEVEAELRTTISQLPYSVRTTAHLVLARSPHAVEPDRRTARIALAGGELDESNGFNCVRPAGSCVTRKLGVSRLRHSARRLFVNLVLLTGPKRADARNGDAARLGPVRITVRRYPPSD
jgi:hypothetical protein